jgi:alkanesulfonate monooxygenase SsuD/methylene tetrahydromethanopterin reductase-like flavin-dependent oxidoreductase (luciferase family)
MNTRIDDAAHAAGRDPAAVTRFLNIAGRFSGTGGGLLTGPPQQWAEELTDIALAYGISGFILIGDEPAAIERYAREVAPQVRALVAAERGA